MHYLGGSISQQTLWFIFNIIICPFIKAYLRFWAKELEVPMLCVDYSLAPAAPFPRALEEVYYAYAWALANKEKLGKGISAFIRM